MTISRCGKRYRTFDAAILAAENRISKGAKPLEVVGCGFCGQWHVVAKGTTIGQAASKPDPFPPVVRSMLNKRDECCQRCGYTGRLEAHHRRAKASGGSSARAHTQCACNGVLLCRRCHEWVHLNPRKARAEGWIVLQSVARPGSVPITCDPGTTRKAYAPDTLTEAGPHFPTCEGGW
jgi:hypothetical protein